MPMNLVYSFGPLYGPTIQLNEFPSFQISIGLVECEVPSVL